jgi:GTPase SAR1 family protein
MFEEISREVKRIYREVIDPMAERLAFEERPSDGEIAGGPLVLVVGNHSSGKSTFLNHILEQDVQRTGMAPTDDSFTILRFGEQARELDGNAIVSNPELPFRGMARFGEDFLSHFRMKVLPIPLLRGVTLIDSPGMIDAAAPDVGRGYDFAAVIRAFAEKADVVLVFFDPDRPGTTAESLSVLTSSLAGFDHKLQVVMNKMDQFRSMRDFARCYGALCWNLGKVIKKKDIPQIYTTYVPVEGAPVPVLPLEDFELARHELIQEIQRAPERRVDNMITQASRFGERLQMHGQIVVRARSLLRRYEVGTVAVALAVVLVLVGIGCWFFESGPLSYAIIAWLLALVVGYGSWVVGRKLVRDKEAELAADLNPVFEELFRRELVVGNRPDDLLMIWEQVRPLTRRTIESLGLRALHPSRLRERARLAKCLKEDLPALRARLHRDSGRGGTSSGVAREGEGQAGAE